MRSGSSPSDPATGPATGYGYIRQGELLAEGVHEIAAFREKPDRMTAEGYLNEGGYSWNAGIFYFRPKVMLEEFPAARRTSETGPATRAEASARTVEAKYCSMQRPSRRSVQRRSTGR